jgi:hypothetical protein
MSGDNGIESWATLAMSAATLWMAYETRKMASASKRALELEAAGQLAVDGVVIRIAKVAEAPTALQIGLKLRNPGKVTTTYSVFEFKAQLQGVQLPEGTFESSGGVLHAGALMEFYLAPTSWPLDAPPELHGQIAFDIEFWATETRRQRCKGTIHYHLAVASGAITWNWVGWPIYT